MRGALDAPDGGDGGVVRALLCAVIALLAVGGCGTAAAPPAASPSSSPPSAAASDLAAQYGLHLRGQAHAVRVKLPRRLSASKAWANEQLAAEDIGLTLRPYRGQTVQLTSYDLAERLRGHPASLWTVTMHGSLVGAFVSTGEGPRAFDLEAPGIYSLKDASRF